MPIKRAALRQMRKDKKRAARNQDVLSELKTLKKQFRTLVDEKKQDEASKLLSVVIKRFDQAATKKIIHRNVADRQKSRLTKALARTA